MYANTDGVYRADDAGPVNIETNYNGNMAPIQMPSNIPEGTRAVYANKGPVVEANKMQGLTLKSTYNEKQPPPPST